MQRRYRLYRKNGEVHFKWNPECKIEYEWHKVTDPHEIVHDGDLLRVGRKFILVVSSDAPIEWEETYGIREQMIAIWGAEKAQRQLGAVA